MGRKLLFEDVKKAFEKRNYQLLEKEYIRSNIPMKFSCPNHPDKDLKISYNKLQSGRGCKYCSKEKQNNAQRHPIEKIKSKFEDKGYILLDNFYIDSHTPLKYKCLKHPNKVLKIAYRSLLNGHGCKYCGREKLSSSKRVAYETVSREFEKRGYILLEKEYINNQQKLRYLCPKHPEENIYITRANLIKGSGCSFCKKEALREHNLKYTIEIVSKKFEERGYRLLETQYIRNTHPMKFSCPNHPNEELYIRLHDFLKGQGCYKCGIENRSGENSYNWKGVITLLSHYLRSFLKDWIFESLKKHDFTCFISKERGIELDVHHSVSFHQLRDIAVKECNLNVKQTIGGYTSEELNMIVSKVKHLHEQIEGIPLRKDIHQLFHEIYGKENNTINQLYEFKERWDNGEFKESCQ